MSDVGSARALIRAVRHSYRKNSSTSTTSTQPRSSDLFRLLSDISMKVAGRKMVESISRPFRPGRMAFRAASTCRVTSRVLAPGCFSTMSSRPGPSFITASPMGAGKPSTTCATSPSFKLTPLRKVTGIWAKSAADWMAEDCDTARRWLGESMKPPPASAVASAAAFSTSARVRPRVRSCSGFTSTCSCRSRWPQMATLATPGTAISRGRMLQRASVVISTCVRLSDDTPIFSTRLVDESGESITGGRATPGSVGATRASRSCTACRALLMSIPCGKYSTTDDKPSTDLERIFFTSGVPFRAFSSGTLTRASTSAVLRPGASVCTST